MVIFMGTVEEFKAVRPMLESLNAQVADWAAVEPSEDERDGPTEYPTVDEALAALRYNGGLSRNQRSVFDVLIASDSPIGSNEIQEKTGLSGPQMRGIMGNLPRRAKGAIGEDRKLLERRWVEWEDGKWQNEYELPTSVREAYASEYP